ncbi:MAG: glycosyltransferase family 9 protein [Phycisphaeraceae bacterium]
MPKTKHNNPPSKALVLMPGLLGESVMATATLDALRAAWPDAHITVLVKRKLRPVLYGLDSVDRVLSIRKRLADGEGKRKSRGRASLIRLGRRLSRGGFDAAVILPNSFKAAALAAVAGIPRRVGYERDGRGVLLTDRLIPRRHRGAFVPVPTLDAYLGIARYLGAERPSPAMHQRVRPESEAQLRERLAGAGIDADHAELMLVNPGAPKSSRRWSPRRMAHLCELMVERFGVTPVVTGTPNERDAVGQLLDRATVPIIDLPELGTDLHLLKAMIARSRMMVTNDTGPRHLAAALGTPLLTLFGPTVPQWSAIDFADEQQAVADGISVAARDDPEFEGPASLDRLHADNVFMQACALYQRTRSRRPAGAGV